MSRKVDMNHTEIYKEDTQSLARLQLNFQQKPYEKNFKV